MNLPFFKRESVNLEPCDWTWLPFSKYQAFPKNAKPITTWTNANEAFLDVIQGIRKVSERLFEQRQQKFKEKEAAQNRYLKKVEEILSFDGEISIPGQDTLDELREELGLTPKEAKELQTRAFEPYKKYKENLRKYEKTFLKVIQQEYPISNKSQEALKLRQRDLGIRPEDAEPIEKRIIAQKKVNIFPKSLELKDENIDSIQLTGEHIQQLQPQQESLLNSINTASQTQQKNEISTALDPIFLERCQREFARHVGPMAHFILKDTLAEHPRITPQQLVELLSTEIPNSQQAKQFKEHLL
jgi:hypothetical protein